jgi:ZIP family zinc transporter
MTIKKQLRQVLGKKATRRMYKAYGLVAADVLHGVFDLDTTPRRHLLPTAIERATPASATAVSALKMIPGFAAGFAVITALDVLIPHAHARFRERGRMAAEERAASERATLLVSALTIHNVPEGIAVGVAFAAGGPELGVPIAIAIGTQNVPEGFAAAAPLLAAGTPRRRAIGVAALTGIVEPPAALAAYGSFELASALLPVGLAFAAGAMLYVVIDELVPEAQGRGNERIASLGFLIGFSLMMGLDNAFG